MSGSLLWLRLFKLAVLVGIPVLAVVYATQFTLVESEEAQPFKTFKVPETTVLKNNEGNLVDLEFREPITVVNFWATWCPPCVSEFPSMIELQRLLEGKGVEIIFISVDDSWDKVQKFLADNVIEVRSDRQYWDADKLASGDWGSVRFPETYVVRKDGWVVEKIVGEQRWTRPIVVKYFENLARKVVEDLNIEVSFQELIFPVAHAQGIHQEDQKNLEKLRNNIATSTENLLSVQAAIKDEERNLGQVKLQVNKQNNEISELKNQHSKLMSKKADLEGQKLKNDSARRSEAHERNIITSSIKDNQALISELEEKLEQARVKLIERQKSLNTRTQNIESLEKAKESLDDDFIKLNERLEASNKTIRDEESELNKFKKEESSRVESLENLKSKLRSNEKVLDEQKAKLKEFEKILNQ